jgi:hypothetical protein
MAAQAVVMVEGVGSRVRLACHQIHHGRATTIPMVLGTTVGHHSEGLLADASAYLAGHVCVEEFLNRKRSVGASGNLFGLLAGWVAITLGTLAAWRHGVCGGIPLFYSELLDKKIHGKFKPSAF